MPEKVGFWKSLEKNRKLQIMFVCASMAVLIAVYLLSVRFIHNVLFNEILQSETAFEDMRFAVKIETVRETEKGLEFDGWALRTDSSIISGHVVLQPLNDGEAMLLDTDMENRSDIKAYFDVSWAAGMCGLNAVVNRNEVQPDICYEILFIISYEDIEGNEEKTIQKETKKITTRTYLYNDELYEYIPTEYIAPSIHDIEIETVVSEGKICGYDIEKQIWVYQYKEKLFLILGSELYKKWEGNLEVPYHLWTTQNNKLPDNRKQNGYDNRDFVFANKEIHISSDEYHVAVTSIPQEYPITNIRLGIFDSQKNEWIWRADFFPEVN